LLHYEEILFTYPTTLITSAVPAKAAILRGVDPLDLNGIPDSNSVHPDLDGIVTTILSVAAALPLFK
tara:strand:- start:517 stop:717 length:201 start_codon:yes stop_codon:yes gene_type:complete